MFLEGSLRPTLSCQVREKAKVPNLNLQQQQSLLVREVHGGGVVDKGEVEKGEVVDSKVEES